MKRKTIFKGNTLDQDVPEYLPEKWCDRLKMLQEIRKKRKNMKNIIILLLLSTIMLSCQENVDKIKNTDGKNSVLIEITLDGKTHEFVRHHSGFGDCAIGGLAHWPDCIYCNAHNLQNPEGNPDDY